jgi:hypothetical protein
MSFFCPMPSKQGAVQGRFKPAHRPTSLGTRVKGSVRRFETPIALSDGRAWQKKDISMLLLRVLSKSFSIIIQQQNSFLRTDED